MSPSCVSPVLLTITQCGSWWTEPEQAGPGDWSLGDLRPPCSATSSHKGSQTLSLVSSAGQPRGPWAGRRFLSRDPGRKLPAFQRWSQPAGGWRLLAALQARRAPGSPAGRRVRGGGCGAPERPGRRPLSLPESRPPLGEKVRSCAASPCDRGLPRALRSAAITVNVLTSGNSQKGRGNGASSWPPFLPEQRPQGAPPGSPYLSVKGGGGAGSRYAVK